MSELRELLKEATAGRHAALERTPLLRAFAASQDAEAVYEAYLLRQWQIHAVMEPAVRCCLGPGADDRLVKADWLLQDLRALGVTPSARVLPWTAPRSRAEAFGTLYVLEGATLGVRQVARLLPPDHPARRHAGRFVAGYGDHTGARWKEWVVRMGEWSAEDWPAVCDGANEAFRVFELIFSEWCDDTAEARTAA